VFAIAVAVPATGDLVPRSLNWLVDIEEAEDLAAVAVEQTDLALVEAAGVVLELGLADLGIAVTQAADAEFVQMIVPPAEGGLDDAMQLTEMEAARYD
jgi:hypothetical protein